jgi:hypothetical protein
MSQLGHLQTSRESKRMSALPPESGHRRHAPPRPLRAKCRLMHCNKSGPHVTAALWSSRLALGSRLRLVHRQTERDRACGVNQSVRAPIGVQASRRIMLDCAVHWALSAGSWKQKALN